MKKAYKHLLVLFVIAGFLATTLSFTTTPSAHAATNAGSLDLRGYCQTHGYGDVTTFGTTVYDWYCINPTLPLVPSTSNINMTNACRWQYGVNSGAIDVISNFYVATSATCVYAPTLLGGINLKWYCQTFQASIDVTTVGTTAYDWRCVKSDGSLVVLDTRQMAFACVYQYGTVLTVSRFANFYTMTSWQCWM